MEIRFAVDSIEKSSVEKCPTADSTPIRIDSRLLTLKIVPLVTNITKETRTRNDLLVGEEKDSSKKWSEKNVVGVVRLSGHI